MQPLREGRQGREADHHLEPDEPESAPAAGWLTTTAGVVLVVAVLYVGRGVLIPLAIAILLSFLLAPLVIRLIRWHVPRVLAVILVAVAAFLVIAALGLLIGVQVNALARELPSYQSNITTKVRELRDAAPSGGVIDRVSSMVQQLRAEVDPEPAEVPEVPVVQLREPAPSPLDVMRDVAAPILGPIGKAGIVIVLVIFILLEREDLRNRLIRLLGPNLRVTTEALDEAGQRVSRYLLMQLVVNLTYGIPLGIGLYFIGIPNAILWATLAVLLRFIPYLGPLLAAAFPIVLAVAVDPGWTTLLLTLGFILALELISNNFVEPWLYGASTSMSAVAIIFAAIFWTTLWGPIGLLLATPITVCLAVMGRYFPQLAFLDVLLGSAPALTLPERFYQRLLAGDVDENIRLAEDCLAEAPLTEFYDEVVLPALRLAAADSVLGSARRQVVTRAALQVVAELTDREETASSAEAAGGTEVTERGAVLCGAGRPGLDFVVVGMLAQLLERKGFAARVVPAPALSAEYLDGLELPKFAAICLSYLDPGSAKWALRTSHRIARRAPGTPIVLGWWSERAEEEAERLPEPAVAVSSLLDAVAAVLRATGVKPYLEAPIPSDEQERLEALKSLRPVAADAAELEPYTSRLTKAFEAPIALVTLIDEHHQNWLGQTGLPEELATAGKAPRETSLCGHVVAGNEPLIIEDALADPRFAENPFLLEHGIRFYAGAPLRGPHGHALGSVCVIDSVPRTITEEQKALLLRTAREVVAALEAHARQSAPPPVSARA